MNLTSLARLRQTLLVHFGQLVGSLSREHQVFSLKNREQSSLLIIKINAKFNTSYRIHCALPNIDHCSSESLLSRLTAYACVVIAVQGEVGQTIIEG